MTTKSFLIFIWIPLLFLKLVFSYYLPFSHDEAYYWVWGQNLQLSYFDHPPLVGWLLGLGEHHFKEGHSSRWPYIFVAHIGLWAWFEILRSLKFESKFWTFLALFICSPLLGVGSIIATPDAIVLSFWALSTLFLIRYLQTQKWLDAVLMGASIGAGFLSKYHIALFVIFVLIFLVFEKQWRKVRPFHALLALISGLAVASPVFIWNFMNDFASFRFQVDHGLGEDKWDPWWTLSYPLGQIIALFPLVVWMATKAKAQGLTRVLLYLGWGPLIFFLLSSFRGLVEINWPIVGYGSIIALAALSGIKGLPLKMSLLFHGGLSLFLIVHSLYPFTDIKKLNEPFVYAPLTSWVKNHQPIFGNTYQLSSWLWYTTKSPVYKLKGISRFDFHDSLAQSQPTKTPYYVIMFKDQKMPSWFEYDRFDLFRIDEVGDYQLVEVRSK